MKTLDVGIFIFCLHIYSNIESEIWYDSSLTVNYHHSKQYQIYTSSYYILILSLRIVMATIESLAKSGWSIKLVPISLELMKRL